MERAEDLPTFGPYQAIDVLGSGGMGVVWRARHRDTGELVALKTSQPRTEALRAIDAEIRVLRRLRHPGVVRVVDSGEQDGMPWMAMAYVEGTPLRALFDTTTRSSSSTLAFDGLEEPTGTDTGEGAVTGLPVEEVASLFVRVCTVLAWLHGEGVVHADLKPENILIAPDGRPVLVDFGLLRAGGARAEVLDGRSRTMGTLHYLAPEAGQRPLDARADLYAVGCMIFELVAGMPPFRGSPGEVLRARREEAAPRLSEHVPDVPPRLDRLVASLLATEPEDRPAYATDVVAALLSCGGRPEPDVGPEPRAYLYRSRLLERDEARQRVTGLAPAVLVVGEAGSGRTRLLQEAETRAGRVLSSLTGRAVDGRDLTRQLVRGVFNLAPSAEIAASWFGPDADLLGPLDPAVAALVGARPPRRFVSRAVEEEQTALALARVVVAAGPLRVVVDDLDEADGVAVSALVGLARRAAEGVGGIQLRVAARTGAAVVERLAEVGAEVVALAPLSDAALHQLIADRLAVRTAPPDLRELVAERAEGSPLVAGELLHLLLDRGLLVRRGDAWRLSGDTASFVAGIADGDAIAARRLESLDAATLAELERLAVLGDTPLDLDLQLEEARARGIVSRDGGGWRFAHERLRARVSFATAQNRRAALHAEIALSLGPEHPPWHRARHLEAAGQLADARAAWVVVSTWPDAPRVVREEATEALLRLDAGEPSTAALRVRWVEELIAGRRFEEALPHLGLLLEEAEATGDPALGFRARALAADVRESCRLAPLSDLLALADEAVGLPLEEAEVRMAIGRRRIPEALPGLERAVALAEAHGDRGLVGRARLLLGCAQQRHGRLRDARRTLTEAEPDLHAPSDLATLYGTRSLVEVNLGDPDAAAGFVERAVVVVRETGSPALLAQTLGLRAEIWRVLDRLDDARRGFDEADRMAEEVGALDVRAKVANSRMIVSQMAGDPPEVSLTLVDEALALAERAGNLRLRAGALLHRAGLQHRRQRLDDAEHAAALAEAGYREVGDVGGVTHAQATRGKILVDLGRLEDARAVLEAATVGARALGGGPFVAAVESLRALLAPDPSGSEEGGAADSTVQ